MTFGTKCISVLTVFFSAVFILSACSSDAQDIVGEWVIAEKPNWVKRKYLAHKSDIFQFWKDGSCVWGTAGGHCTLMEQNQIKVNFPMQEATPGYVGVLTYSISGDVLTLTDSALEGHIVLNRVSPSQMSSETSDPASASLAEQSKPSSDQSATQVLIGDALSQLAVYKLAVAEFYATRGRFPKMVAELKISPSKDVREPFQTVGILPDGGVIRAILGESGVAGLQGYGLYIIPSVREAGSLVWECKADADILDFVPSACQRAMTVRQSPNSELSSVAKQKINRISMAVEAYFLDTGLLPNSLDDFVRSPGDVVGWAGPYISSRSYLIDPWGNRFHYRNPGHHGDFDIYSLGADGQWGGSEANEDVTSW